MRADAGPQAPLASRSGASEPRSGAVVVQGSRSVDRREGDRHARDPCMNRQSPTPQAIDELIAFLPRLAADGFVPIREWGGGEKDAKGAYVMPWPVYDPVVEALFEAAGQDCWMDFEYVPQEAGRLLEEPALVRRASLDQIKTMLTYCVRGERFSEGHWAAMIEGGQVRRLLERLPELGSTYNERPGGSEG